MEVTIIIPTYNRCDDLSTTLQSVFHQTKCPKEILIIDDSENEFISDLVTKEMSHFVSSGINLKYFRNPHQKGSGIARNYGMSIANEEIILFLDDDVILDKGYIAEIIKIYEQFPEVIGVQGYIINNKHISKFRFLYNKIFFLYNQEKNSCRVLISTNVVYPSVVNDVIECEWLSGCNQSYRKNILTNFKFDENFKRYSLKEDVDLSYRIFKNNPGSLRLTPNAKLIHKATGVARMPGKTVRYMEYVHSFYLFYKNMDPDLIKTIKFYWAWGGELLFMTPFIILSNFLSGSKEGYSYLKFGFKALTFCLQNLKNIKKGDLSFFYKNIG
jgi:GT2 family glycosyltransferase